MIQRMIETTVKRRNKMMLQKYSTVPIVSSPLNLCGLVCSRMLRIPVPMLTLNQEGVKLRTPFWNVDCGKFLVPFSVFLHILDMSDWALPFATHFAAMQRTGGRYLGTTDISPLFLTLLLREREQVLFPDEN